MDLRDVLKSRLVLLDGGMGTELQKAGLAPGEVPEMWNIAHPEAITAVHEAYLKAGSDIIYANTFGANGAKFEGDCELEDVVFAGVRLAKDACGKFSTPGKPRFAALDVGPTGRLLEPAGNFSFDEAYEAFARQIRAGVAAGADLVVVETMGDTYELKAAVLAAKENSDLPVIATVALGEDGKLLTGADVDCVAALLEGLRVDAAGFNCGLGPDLMLPYVKQLRSALSIPVVVKPNAGLPVVEDGKTLFRTGPEEFAKTASMLVEAGASILGGCCGTTPDHIGALRRAAEKLSIRLPWKCDRRKCVVSSGMCAVEIPVGDTIVIGERINPTGKKKLREALVSGDIAYILREAVAQAEAGAALLDVNAGVPGIDEPAVLERTVRAVQSVVNLPLQIDTSDLDALERALRHYNGKALINSVNGKRESMDGVLPLAAKYGGAVTALLLDENGIPPTVEGRMEIARRILARGADFGLDKDDFVFDALTLSVSAEPEGANIALETLRRIRAELGCRTVMGVSNISFGLPGRAQLNAAFYMLAMGAGLSAAIINPLSTEMMTAFRSFRALVACDRACASWIDSCSKGLNVAQVAAAPPVAPKAGNVASDAGDNKESALFSAIRRGLKEDAATAARAELDGGASPVQIIDGSIVPALECVGRGFEAKTVFLPQLLMAADAAGAAFDAVRKSLEKSGGAPAEKGPVVIATVKGDIHDIGKNIVRALLENYGFKVIDLGRDVPPELIVETAKREKAPLVGLSALMTTTVKAMEETVKLVHETLPGCKVMVGGAVLTAAYAAQIGADFYSKDAMGAVRTAGTVCSC